MEDLQLKLVRYLSVVDESRVGPECVKSLLDKSEEELKVYLIMNYGLSLLDFEAGVLVPPFIPSPVDVALVLIPWLTVYFYKYPWESLHMQGLEDFVRGKNIATINRELRTVYGEDLVSFSNGVNFLREELIIFFSLHDTTRVSIQGINPLLGWSTRNSGRGGVNQILSKFYCASLASHLPMPSIFRGDNTIMNVERIQRLAREDDSARIEDYLVKGAKLVGKGERLLRHWHQQGLNEASKALYSELFSRIKPAGDKIWEKIWFLQSEPSVTWKERSLQWMDSMHPCGRHWLDIAMKSSLLVPGADMSWAFEDDCNIEEEWKHQIDVDIPRTFPEIDYFEDISVRCSFKRILLAVAVTVPDVGYVQGMNFIAGYLMLHTKEELETHRLMVEILVNPKYSLRQVFVDGLPGLSKICETLKVVIKDRMPALFAHFKHIGFDDLYFSYQWISTLFTYTMPFDALVQAWDLFFETGWIGFFQVAVTLIMDNADMLFTQDFDEACVTMKMSAVNPREDCFQRARGVVFSRQHQARILRSCD